MVPLWFFLTSGAQDLIRPVVAATTKDAISQSHIMGLLKLHHIKRWRYVVSGYHVILVLPAEHRRARNILRRDSRNRRYSVWDHPHRQPQLQGACVTTKPFGETLEKIAQDGRAPFRQLARAFAKDELWNDQAHSLPFVTTVRYMKRRYLDEDGLWNTGYEFDGALKKNKEDSKRPGVVHCDMFGDGKVKFSTYRGYDYNPRIRP